MSDSLYERYVDWGLTRNAHYWLEKRHAIRYWGPIDPREPFEVVYKFAFNFPVRSASLFASINLCAEDSSGVLEVSSDRGSTWKEVVPESGTRRFGAPVDISQHVNGARLIYVRARLKGRDDGQDSALAQFLRTATQPDGHFRMRSPHVFELRVYDVEVPILTGTVEFDDGWDKALRFYDGVFWVDRTFDKPGEYWATITVRAGSLKPVAKVIRIVSPPSQHLSDHLSRRTK